MESILIALGAFAAYLIAYHTYGKFLARKIFQLDEKAVTPAVEVNDGRDFVPTKLEVLFGHHYTSIAGTGPIVGPAIGIIWGWVPALVWVLLGSIFMGAVHDFGALVISARNQGKSIGDIAGRMISRRVQIMFLAIVCLALLIVIAIFCLVIASLFSMFPQSVIPIWVEVPIALVIGHLVYRRNMKALPLSIIGVVLLYVFVVVGAYVPVEMPSIGPFGPLVIWTVILLIFDAFIASILPVWRLLQPRDYINSHELFVVLLILTLAVLASRPEIVAPAINLHPSGAPPIWPFLFITIACGAISGFHSLVGSGTTSKQLSNEKHALTIGYGGMLMEGVLAVLVIIAVAGGLGLAGEGGLAGVEAWREHYSSWSAAGSLGKKVGAFVQGSSNMLVALGLPRNIGITIMGVFVASFAATTLDTATRLQRYVISELASGLKLKPLTNIYAASALAVVSAGVLALGKGGGKGGLMLWPLFGATNQLLACLALLVVTVYLKRRGRRTVYTLIPMLIMLVITGFAMGHNLKDFYLEGWESLHLFLISAVIVFLEAWMVIESFVLWVRGGWGESPPAEGSPKSGFCFPKPCDEDA